MRLISIDGMFILYFAKLCLNGDLLVPSEGLQSLVAGADVLAVENDFDLEYFAYLG